MQLDFEGETCCEVCADCKGTVGRLISIAKECSWQQSRAHPGGIHCQSSHALSVMCNMDSLWVDMADVCAKYTVAIQAFVRLVFARLKICCAWLTNPAALQVHLRPRGGRLGPLLQLRVPLRSLQLHPLLLTGSGHALERF